MVAGETEGILIQNRRLERVEEIRRHWGDIKCRERKTQDV